MLQFININATLLKIWLAAQLRMLAGTQACTYRCMDMYLTLTFVSRAARGTIAFLDTFAAETEDAARMFIVAEAIVQKSVPLCSEGQQGL